LEEAVVGNNVDLLNLGLVLLDAGWASHGDFDFFDVLCVAVSGWARVQRHAPADAHRASLPSLAVAQRLLAAPEVLSSAAAGLDAQGQSVLMHAAQRGNAHIVSEMLAHPAVARIGGLADRAGRTALMYAVRGSHKDAVCALLLCPQVCETAGAGDASGFTALMASVNCICTMRALLACEEVVCTAGKADCRGRTALMHAADSRAASHESIAALLAHSQVRQTAGAADARGTTALMLSCFNESFASLAKVQAQLTCEQICRTADAKGSCGLTALNIAQITSQPFVVAALRKALNRRYGRLRAR
jgi:ankyrin repeat protein